jgi:hypothetical protein
MVVACLCTLVIGVLHLVSSVINDSLSLQAMSAMHTGDVCVVCHSLREEFRGSLDPVRRAAVKEALRIILTYMK